LPLAVEGLEAPAKKDGGLGGDELSRQVWPLIALAYDVEVAMKQELGQVATRRGRGPTVSAVPTPRGGQ